MTAAILELKLADAVATEALGAALARCAADGGLLLFLHGNLGAGKTTLVRGYLHGLGHGGAVKSPTYTLVEPYELADRSVYHFDLYRLGDAEELEFLGIRDYLTEAAQCLVEWPERGAGVLPAADLELTLDYQGAGRLARVQAGTERGGAILSCLRYTWAVG
ncbi:MAG: tRNA (adenosine(37)-N6)-threonylcarbamoyltransferase complex ATPase subunit type 1 TsaE [Pseudomonadota bacterium]